MKKNRDYKYLITFLHYLPFFLFVNICLHFSFFHSFILYICWAFSSPRRTIFHLIYFLCIFFSRVYMLCLYFTKYPTFRKKKCFLAGSRRKSKKNPILYSSNTINVYTLLKCFMCIQSMSRLKRHIWIHIYFAYGMREHWFRFIFFSTYRNIFFPKCFSYFPIIRF